MSPISSLILYLTLFSCSALLFYYGNKRRNRITIGMSLLIPVILGGLRYNVGTDYSVYISMYNNLARQPFLDFSTNIEFGFLLLAKIAYFMQSPLFLFLSSCFLTVLFFYLALRRLKVARPALIYFLFLLIIFPMTLNVMRQGIALSVCLYAFTFMIERRFWKYLFWMVIASMFHMTSLILLPVYFLNRFVKEKNNNYIFFLIKLLILCGVILVLLPYFFSALISIPMFEKYDLYQTYIGEGNNITFYIELSIFLLGLVVAKWAAPKKNASIYLFTLLFAALEVVFLTLGFTSTFIKRMALYFTVFNLLLLTNFVDIFKDRTGQFIMYSVIILYGLTYFYVSYFQLGQADIFPYQWMIGGGV
jgi:transmembrane protein EpsG